MNVKKAAIVSLCLFFCSSYTVPVAAAPVAMIPASQTAAMATRIAISTSQETATPYSYDYEWYYQVENGKLYKRLFNTHSGQWIGSWIYVCDVK